VGEKGALRRVILRRDRAKGRWTYSVHDTAGVWDGDLGAFPINGPFVSAADQLNSLITEHWKQPITWTWVARADDQWASGPEIDGSTAGTGIARPQSDGDRSRLKAPLSLLHLERALGRD
jgi:hypothetical protein